jgi:4a-hydroxytetrahydrobiopterin dehydratase
MSLLDDDDIAGGLRGLAWERDGKVLVRTVRSEDFAGSLAVVNRVGTLAEAADHHPDIDIRWNVVTLRLSTHSAGGLTQLDLDLARSIDEAVGGSSTT